MLLQKTTASLYDILYGSDYNNDQISRSSLHLLLSFFARDAQDSNNEQGFQLRQAISQSVLHFSGVCAYSILYDNKGAMSTLETKQNVTKNHKGVLYAKIHFA